MAGTTPSDPAKAQEVEESAKRILDAGGARDVQAKPAEFQWLSDRLQAQEIKHKDAYAKQELKLRATYANWLLIILAANLVVVNVIFWMYGEKGENWGIPDGVIQAWLGATVVQVVGVVGVVTRYLFPHRDRDPEPPVPPAPPTLSPPPEA